MGRIRHEDNDGPREDIEVSISASATGLRDASDNDETECPIVAPVNRRGM